MNGRFNCLRKFLAARDAALELAGEVLIQTLQPTNAAIEMAVEHDYETFFESELKDRESLHYPPFSRLILIEFRGLHESATEEHAKKVCNAVPGTRIVL